MIVVGILRDLSKHIEKAAAIAVEDLQEGIVETEPSLTDRFIGAMEGRLSTLEIGGYRFKIRTLRDRGRGAPEHEFGADLVGVLDVDIPSYKVSKGFLAQAKLANKGEITVKLPGSCPGYEYPEITVSIPRDPSSSRLVSQCKQMLSVTPDSYVFVYSQFGIFVIPASAITSIAPGSCRPVYSKRIGGFFMEHMMSFIGDLGLEATSDDALRSCRERTNARYAMLLEMRAIERAHRWVTAAFP